MSNWREMAAAALEGEDKRDTRDKRPPNAPSVPTVPASQTLNDWHRHLSVVDYLNAPVGWEIGAWLKLTDTAFWLYENHAAYAVRNGWNAPDLFGVRTGYPQCGGLAELLDGARNLKLSGGKAYWSHHGSPFNIGIGIGKGCTLLWELDR